MALELRGKVAVAQMSPRVGNVRENGRQILDYISRARAAGAELIVIGEAISTGYILGDVREHEAFLREVETQDDRIRCGTKGITAIWGSIKVDWTKIGKNGRVRIYNAARIAANGQWLTNGILTGWIPKTNLPDYRFFEDPRYFYPGSDLATEMGYTLEKLLWPFPVKLDGREIMLALAICEDLWDYEYPNKISRIHAAQHADLMVDISASPWTVGKYRARDRMLKNSVKNSGLPILYVNRVGLENNTKNLIWFDGDSTLINADGEFQWRAPQHKAGLYLFELGQKYPETLTERVLEIEEIDEALVLAHREFYGKFKKVVIGLSGGIDSALGLVYLVQAIGADKVLAVNMPSNNNSQTTQRLAEECARANGVEYRVVPIQELVDLRVKVLAAAGFLVPEEGLVLENIQARERGAGMLAAIAQLLDGVFTNNANRTEIGFNYFTLYGDGAGAASMLGDLPKGYIYALAKLKNKQAGREVVKIVIPEEIIDQVPSAELSPKQNVDKGMGDPIFYPYHDYLITAFVEKRWDPTVVLEHALRGDFEERLGCEKGTIKKYFPTRAAFVENLEWAWAHYTPEFKRPQIPMVFVVTRRSFGYDRRATIAESFSTEQYDVYKKLYLSEQD